MPVTPRLVFLLLVLLAMLAPPAAGQAIELRSRPLPLNSEKRDQQAVGPLLWRGTLEIESPDPRFGGFSALWVAPDGSRITALNDKGHWLTARLRHDAEGRLAGLDQGTMASYLSPAGKPLVAPSALDAESLTVLPNGDWLVGFEWHHRLWRYPAAAHPLAQPAKVFTAPPWLGQLPSNKGMEALAALADGRLLVLSEGLAYRDGLAAFLYQDGRWHRNSYRTKGGFAPTDAAVLPDGDVLLLERRFTLLGGLSARLLRLDQGQITPGATLQGRELARLHLPLNLDNMEGLAVRRGRAGETLVYLISDDNFNPLQRTLLMLFALAE